MDERCEPDRIWRGSYGRCARSTKNALAIRVSGPEKSAWGGSHSMRLSSECRSVACSWSTGTKVYAASQRHCPYTEREVPLLDTDIYVGDSDKVPALALAYSWSTTRRLEVHALQDPTGFLVIPSAFLAVRLSDVTESGRGPRV